MSQQEKSGGLSLAAQVTKEALKRGEAVIVVGDWMSLVEMSQLCQAWKDYIITPRFARKEEVLRQWVSAPNEPLFCTPSILTENHEIIGMTERPLTVIFTKPDGKDEVLALLKDKCKEMEIVDVENRERTLWDTSISSEPSRLRLWADRLGHNQWGWLF